MKPAHYTHRADGEAGCGRRQCTGSSKVPPAGRLLRETQRPGRPTSARCVLRDSFCSRCNRSGRVREVSGAHRPRKEMRYLPIDKPDSMSRRRRYSIAAMRQIRVCRERLSTSRRLIRSRGLSACRHRSERADVDSGLSLLPGRTPTFEGILRLPSGLYCLRRESVHRYPYVPVLLDEEWFGQ